MNTAKLVNSALTGGGLIYPENLNVIIGNESKGYPKGYVLDANATLSLAGTNGTGNNSSNPTDYDLGLKALNYKLKSDFLNDNREVSLNNVLFESDNYNRKNLLFYIKDENQNIRTISGLSNIIIGADDYIVGSENIIMGKTVYTSGFNNILNGNKVTISLVKNTENDKLRIKARQGSQVMELLENGFLYILPQFAIKNNTVSANNNAPKDPIKLVNYTRISDEIIQLEDENLKSLKDFDKIILAGIYAQSNTSIALGSIISSIDASKSISVGNSLKNEAFNGVYPNTYQVFGTLNTVKSNFEFACGSRNVSTKNDNFSTRFSVGAGLTPSDYKNAFEIGFKKSGATSWDANTYVLGIGNYNGKNAADNNTKSLQEVISDISSNSAPLSSYDSVLKCVNSKPMQSSVLDIIDCVKDVLKRGWKNIAVNAMFTKDNEWIVSNTMLFKKGEENKTSTELTLAEIKSDPRNNFSIIDDVCLLAKFYGANVYIYVQNPAAKDIYTKTGDLYNGMSHIQKLVYQLKMFGLSSRYSIVALDQQVLQQVIFADDNARVGLLCITKFYTNTQLNSNISDFIRDVKGQLPNNSENVFIISNFDIVKDMPINIMLSLARPNCKLEVSNLDNNINIFDFKFSNPYITAAICNDVHIGKKLLESNV